MGQPWNIYPGSARVCPGLITPMAMDELFLEKYLHFEDLVMCFKQTLKSVSRLSLISHFRLT